MSAVSSTFRAHSSEHSEKSAISLSLNGLPFPTQARFAIRKIKKGTILFSGDVDEVRWIDAKDLPRDKDLREFYERFAIVKNGKDGKPRRYGCPRNFHRLTMSWYINDPKPGEKPNMICDTNYNFRAVRSIKEGEELTVDSTTYSDHAGKPKSASKPTPR